MEKLQELIDKRQALVVEQQGMLDTAEKEGRAFDASEQEKYDKIDKDFDGLTDQISEIRSEADLAAKIAQDHASRQEKLEQRKAFLEQSIKEPLKVSPKVAEKAREHIESENRMFRDYRATEAYSDFFRDYLRTGIRDMRDMPKEVRDLQMDVDTKGGYLVAPEQFVNMLIKNVDNRVFVRQYATVIPVPNAVSLGAPALDNDPADPDWTAELKVGSEDSTMDFDKRNLYPHPLAKYIKVSNDLLMISAMNVEALVNQRLGYKFAVTEENAFLNGTGANQPLGIFTASAQGINTGRDVSTGNTNTAIKGDGLIEAKYTLKPQHRGMARWIFHRDAIKNIRKLKDGAGDYLWRAGIANGAPDTILDLPFDESEYAPNTFTSGLYVGALCNWEYFWVADAYDMTIKVVDQLYAPTNQTAYFARKKTDGMPVLEEAFVRVTLT